MRKARRIVNMVVLPREPVDGSGRTCIHLVVRDPAGPFTEPHVLHPVVDERGQQVGNMLEARPTRMRLACDPNRLVAPTTSNGVTTITQRSDDPRAVTCPRCKKSEDYKQIMNVVSKP